MDPSAATWPELPLFPLQTVLFPDGTLALQIFELRYLDMIARCHRSGAPFGVVALSEGEEVRRPAPAAAGDGYAPEAFFEVGTLARITQLERPQPGLLRIRCLGLQRFRLERSALGKYGLWSGSARRLADDAVVSVPEDLAPTRSALQALVRNIEHSVRQSGESGSEVPVHRPYRWDDCGWLANRWCELLPLEREHKQRLLALDSPLLRLELVSDTLAQLGVVPRG
jgi:Lon protease-like protein